MVTALVALLLMPVDSTATTHSSDARPLVDPTRPVTRIAKDGFSLQYFTNEPCDTAVEVRQGDMPRTAFGHKMDGPVRVVRGAGRGRYHTITVGGLAAGKRYFYRILDPGPKTAREKNWGADDQWRREFAVSTEAPKGRKTIIHLPVKVLLMPNVVNVATVGPNTPKPPKMTAADIKKIEDEFAVSSRFFWVNSGMRLWVDYRFFVDDRWQSWGPVPANADPFYQGWPVSRSWAGVEYAGPGGGDFTILDTKDPLRVNKDPVVEEKPYSGQIEMAWLRRWNAQAGKWEFVNSGGGTLGVDQFPQGIPGRSQFLGGGDSAWLATHEFHHDLESHSEWSFAFREDDRIVFNHYNARHRTVKPDGSVDEMTWTTSGRHGEHWDGMAFWDRTLSDAQWLRFYFGDTLTVKDADEDGVPDDDPRLPLDEKRFGSSPSKASTDGLMGDLQKVMLSTWVPGPLQQSWIKPPFQGIVPDPHKRDQDGDGLADDIDPYPLFPNVPLIPFMRPAIDGDASEWKELPPAAHFVKGGIDFTFRQSHDEAGYYGEYEIEGPWKRIDGTFDGEGLGVYSGVGVLGFTAVKDGDKVTVRPQFAGAPGLKIASKVTAGGTVIEFSLPNRGPSPWYWTGGGREIGVAFNVWDEQNRGYSTYEPYHLFYARMMEPNGEQPIPPGAPSELTAGADVKTYLPGDSHLVPMGDWKLENGVFRNHGNGETPLVLSGLSAKDFDLWVSIEGKSDAVLGAFTPSMKEMNAGVGYIGFVGGYGNTVTKLRLFGNEVGESDKVLSPGRHTVQLSRHDGLVWLLVDGKPAAWGADPAPDAVVDRLAIIGGYDGDQTVHEVRVRIPAG